MSQQNEPEMTELERIKFNADMIIKEMSEAAGFELGYDDQSIKWFDEFIERRRGTFDEKLTNAMIHYIGAYLGECLRRRFGGEWEEIDGSWAIAFSSANHTKAFPFKKVAKQFSKGHAAGESIWGFFKVTPVILRGIRPPGVATDTNAPEE